MVLMSTYWYFECMNHVPAVRSVEEFTQHTGDAAFHRALEIAASRPLVVDWDIEVGYFEGNARRFLAQHPSCHLEMASEYGERREVRSPHHPACVASLSPGCMCYAFPDATTLGKNLPAADADTNPVPEDSTDLPMKCPSCGHLMDGPVVYRTLRSAVAGGAKYTCSCGCELDISSDVRAGAHIKGGSRG